MPETGLKEKTIHGVGWSAIDNVSQYLVSFVVSIVLARLLSPDDYGLLGIVAIFTAVCTAIVNGGFVDALIRKKDATEDDYNTVFIVNLIVSILLYVVVFVSSPLIARFFERAELVSITRVASISMVIGALALVQQTRLKKKLDFKTQTKVTLIASITSGVIGITMALLGYGVWALVAQGVSNQAFKTIFLWIYNKWIPRLVFSLNSFNELFGFGWKIMVVGLLESIWQELNQVVVGKFYSPATLGQYTRAKGFSDLFSSNLTNVIQRVTFPVLSTIQDEKDRMLSAYRRIIKTTVFITAVSMFALGAVSEPLIDCLIGSKWYEAATYLPVLCITRSLFPLHAININMLEVQGKSGLFLCIEIIKKILLLVPLYIGYAVGIIPMLWVTLAVSIICYLMTSFFSGKLIGYSVWMQLKDIRNGYFVATIVALSVWFFKYLPLNNWVILLIQIVVGSAVFFIVCRITKLEEYYETVSIINGLVGKKLK